MEFCGTQDHGHSLTVAARLRAGWFAAIHAWGRLVRCFAELMSAIAGSERRVLRRRGLDAACGLRGLDERAGWAGLGNAGASVIGFEFYRLRLHFRALGPLAFPAGKAGNTLRGALGSWLSEAQFRPTHPPHAGPSGLGDPPRPFVLRAAHLDGVEIAAGGEWYLDAHVFDAEAVSLLLDALEKAALGGLGREQGASQLMRVEGGDAPQVLTLEPTGEAPDRVRLGFLTPTELKPAGTPEFGILFARLRDRLSTLRALYGAGPLDVDFRALGERANAIRLVDARLRWEHIERRSTRSGQVHPIGGFTGEVDYEGALGEFLPWLRAARWVGVGRQTVWGKGDVRVLP